ncbi:Ankyrin repeat protein [Giardia duodenalis]|uniref:Ankyrin repeat protein n=1 Tax=Giardia intestinalis TaxID=5741 RepID=V6TN25_GIAIN|nr:Ankyrin repeat protein [Giardia intestinalis]
MRPAKRGKSQLSKQTVAESSPPKIANVPLPENSTQAIGDLLERGADLCTAYSQLANQRTSLLSEQLEQCSNHDLKRYYSRLNEELTLITQISSRLRADLKFIAAQSQGLIVSSSKIMSDDPGLSYSSSPPSKMDASDRCHGSMTESTLQALTRRSTRLTPSEVEDSLVQEFIRKGNAPRSEAVKYAKIAISFDPSGYAVGGDKRSYKEEFIAANSEKIRLHAMLRDSEAEVQRLRSLVEQAPSELETKQLRAKTAIQEDKINSLRSVLSIRDASRTRDSVGESASASRLDHDLVDELTKENMALRIELDNQISIANAQNKTHKQEVRNLREKINTMQSQASQEENKPQFKEASTTPQASGLFESTLGCDTGYPCSDDDSVDKSYVAELEDDLTRALSRIQALTEERNALQADLNNKLSAKAETNLTANQVQELAANNMILSNALTAQHQQLTAAFAELNQKNADQLVLQNTIQQLTAQRDYNSQAIQAEMSSKLDAQIKLYTELKANYESALELIQQRDDTILQMSNDLSSNDRVTMRCDRDNARLELKECKQQLIETKRLLQMVTEAMGYEGGFPTTTDVELCVSQHQRDKEKKTMLETEYALAKRKIDSLEKELAELKSSRDSLQSAIPPRATPASAISAAIAGSNEIITPQDAQRCNTLSNTLTVAQGIPGSATDLIRSMRVTGADLASFRTSSVRTTNKAGVAYASREILNSYTPLMKAIIAGNNSAVSQTISFIGKAALDGTTALMLAAIYDNKEAVEILAPHEAMMKRNDGATALKLALQTRHLGPASILLNYEGPTLPKQLPGYPREVTALMKAAELGDVVLVFSLLASQAGAKDADGRTALMRAARAGFADIVWLLAPQEAGMQLINDTELGPGSTALMLAANQGHLECVKLLIASERKYKNNLNYDALFYAQSSASHVSPEDRASIIALLEEGSGTH